MHSENYYYGSDKSVITIGRNLIDISGTLTSKPKVIGTLFFDVDVAVFDQFFKELRLGENDEFYVLDEADNIYFSNLNMVGAKQDVLTDSNEETLVLNDPVSFLEWPGRSFIQEKKSLRAARYDQICRLLGDCHLSNCANRDGRLVFAQIGGADQPPH